MSTIAEDLELNWWATSYGYRHAHSDYEIHWWNSNRDAVTLYERTADECLPVEDMHGVNLHTAVNYVAEQAWCREFLGSLAETWE